MKTFDLLLTITNILCDTCIINVRLSSNNATQAAHITDLERQVLAVDEDNLRLREFVHKEGILLPKHLRAPPLRSGSSPKAAAVRASAASTSSFSSANLHSTPSSAAGGGAKSRTTIARWQRGGDEGYVEEVDVDVVDVSTSRHYAEERPGGVAAGGGVLMMPKKSSAALSSSSRIGWTLLYFDKV